MPRTRPEPVRATYRNKKLNRDLLDRYGQKSLREWAGRLSADHHIRVTHGTLHRALNDLPPRNPWLRAALGFAPLEVVAEPCADCGGVHVAGTCTEAAPPGMVWVTVLAKHVRNRAHILGRSRRCTRRRCGIHFVGAGRYCSETCRVRARAWRRKQNRTKLVQGRKRMKR